MPAVPPMPDSRHTAIDVARGVTRWWHRQRAVLLTEVPLPNGRRADLVAITPKGQIAIVEVKVARADLLGDQKWPDYLDWCDRFFWALSPDLDAAPLDMPAYQPDRCGLMVADRYDAQLIRDAAEHPMAAARRRSELLRLGRLAALRLMQLGDPELALNANGHDAGF